MIQIKTFIQVGWGRSEDSDPNNPRDHEKLAKEMPLKAVSNEDCFLDFPNLAKISSRRTFCAGWRGFEANACHGDSGTTFVVSAINVKVFLSGSGYFVQNEESGIWEIQGIVSSSPVDSSGKCIVNQYAIFTKVSDFSSWIVAFINAEKDLPTHSVNVDCKFSNLQKGCALRNITISHRLQPVNHNR